jgi:glycosyltransferase involved in cell wall biosynthesis
LPLKVKSACNIYTIHDLIPLRLPFTTLDNKRYMLRLLRKIAAQADHIVTVSEHSKRDIIEILNVDERRVTNTYQSVVLPEQYVQMPEIEMANRLTSLFGLEIYEYLLFFGALEPKKNISRLIDAYLSSSVTLPLLIVGGEGWQTESEQRLLLQLQEPQRPRNHNGRRIQRIDYVTQATLITLIRGARAVVFPSLYEGFGLPVLEAMALGTPVITSTESSVPEVAGDAAVLVDPYIPLQSPGRSTRSLRMTGCGPSCLGAENCRRRNFRSTATGSGWKRFTRRLPDPLACRAHKWVPPIGCGAASPRIPRQNCRASSIPRRRRLVTGQSCSRRRR